MAMSALVTTGGNLGDRFDDARLGSPFLAMRICLTGTVAQYAWPIPRTEVHPLPTNTSPYAERTGDQGCIYENMWCDGMVTNCMNPGVSRAQGDDCLDHAGTKILQGDKDQR
jgi:hypothetical protein